VQFQFTDVDLQPRHRLVRFSKLSGRGNLRRRLRPRESSLVRPCQSATAPRTGPANDCAFRFNWLTASASAPWAIATKIFEIFAMHFRDLCFCEWQHAHGVCRNFSWPARKLHFFRPRKVRFASRGLLPDERCHCKRHPRLTTFIAIIAGRSWARGWLIAFTGESFNACFIFGALTSDRSITTVTISTSLPPILPRFPFNIFSELDCHSHRPAGSHFASCSLRQYLLLGFLGALLQFVIVFTVAKFCTLTRRTVATFTRPCYWDRHRHLTVRGLSSAGKMEYGSSFPSRRGQSLGVLCNFPHIELTFLPVVSCCRARLFPEGFSSSRSCP